MIKIWNHETGECINTLYGHNDIVKQIALVMNTKLLVSGSTD